MNVIDRVESAKHTLTGAGLAKSVSKATSHEVIGPKKKHVDCEYYYDKQFTEMLNLLKTWYVATGVVIFFHTYATGNSWRL